MKNSKPFPGPDWLGEVFLANQELRACRSLFLCQDAELSLTVIDLARLQTALEASGQALAATFLARSEMERYASFAFAKRRLEWLGGRLAAKHAARLIMAGHSGPLPAYRELLVDSAPTGRPLLREQTGGNATLPAISISHSHGYAGALAVWGRSCGLDLQQVTPQVLKVQERFATRDETALLGTAPSLAAHGQAALLTLLWSAKESLRKAIACEPLLGFTEMTLARLESDGTAGVVGHFTCHRPGMTLEPAFLVLHGHFACAITVQSSTPEVHF